MFMNSMDDCHREAGGIDDGTNLAALWDWDSVQLVANSRPETAVDVRVKARGESGRVKARGEGYLDPQVSSLTASLEPEADSSSGVGNEARSVSKRPRLVEPLQSSSRAGAAAASNPTTAVEAEPVWSPDATEQLSSMSGPKSTRLESSNFAAGRPPCGCADNDEDEDVVSRKRTKATAKCQVESCGVDLGKLKGYHQRHRVCLRCANAITVKLKGEPHRYCQQCGKFHKLSDFDDEKRSCRRKLERHNTRRRRKLTESGETVANEAGGSNNDKEPGTADGQADILTAEEKSTPSPERENSGSIEQAPGSLEFDTDPASTLSSTLGSATIDAPPFFVDRCCDTSVTSSLDTLQTSVMCGLSHSGMPTICSGGLQSSIQDTQLQSAAQAGIGEGDLQSGRGNVLSRHVYEDPNFSDEPGVGSRLTSSNIEEMSTGPSTRNWEPPTGLSVDLVGQQFAFAAGRDGAEDESLLSFLLEDDVHEDNFFPSSKNSNHPGMQESELLFHQPPSYRAVNRKAPTYSSPFPTGRISFKLYDWNPGDFPRRLRQQILEWIGNMPVELEGYIRSGCTILTLFLSMHQQMWDEVEENWPAYLKKLVDGTGSGFWDAGNYIACVGDSVCQVYEGDVTEIQNDWQLQQAKLDYVWPICIEAGSSANLGVYGQNLRRGEVRPFISFGGRYLKVNRGQIVFPPGSKEGRDATWCEIKVPPVSPDSSGVLYVEIENDHGTSNHIPVLIADRQVCTELQALMRTLGLSPQSVSPGQVNHYWDIAHMLIQDLGWVFSYSEGCSTVKKVTALAKNEWHSVRLRRLIKFAVVQGLPAVAARILSSPVVSGLGSAAEAYLSPVHGLPHINDTHLDFLQAWMCNSGVAQATRPMEALGSTLSGPELVNQVGFTYVKNAEVVVPINDTDYSTVDGQNLKLPLIADKDVDQKDMEAFLMGRGRRKFRYRNPTFASQHLRIGGRSVMTMVGVTAVCIGACIIFQHPHEAMDYLSGSLRRCLWGSMNQP